MRERKKSRIQNFFVQLTSQLGINKQVFLKAGLTVLILITLRFLFSLSHTTKTLKNHPEYTPQAKNCSALLCNPFERCSTWYSDRDYDWSELAQAGIFRDLATAQVDVGCELDVKIQGNDWATFPSGKTNCLKYSTRCRDLVELKLKANILVLATHLKEEMKERSNEGREITLVHGGQVTNNLDVTLINQLLVGQLAQFSQTVEAWKGPVSLTIYLEHPGDIDTLIDFFKVPGNLQTYSKATIVLVKPNYNHVDHLDIPVNHLRNLAITESLTDYIFVTSTIPSSQLQDLIQTQLIPYVETLSEHKTAWIVTGFEVNEEYEPLPDTYQVWHRWVDQRLAFVSGNGPSLTQPLIKNTFAYEVCYESHWELDYILHRSAPLYDIRFKDQAHDRRSHALHLNAEGYRFKVLHQAFGFIRIPSNNRHREKQTESFAHFDQFVQDIKSVYGRNSAWPRGCSAVAVGWHTQNKNLLGMAVGSA